MQRSDAVPGGDVRSYNTIGLHLGPWLWQSKGHHAAAKVQWKAATSLDTPNGVRQFHQGVALMLAGFSLELLLKMVLLDKHFRNVEFPTEYDKLTKCFPTIHGLRSLATDAGVRINKSDREVLDRLTDYVVWAGRYPVPLKADGYTGPAWLANWSGETTGTAPASELWSKYSALWPRLCKQADIRLRN